MSPPQQDANPFNPMPAGNPRPCIFQCGKDIVYDSTLPNPSYREVGTGLHHSYKRCAEVIGDPEIARQRFQENKRKRIKEQKG